MIRNILKYGAPELVRPSEKITEFDQDLRTLAADMLETMYAAPGIGLAAPQIGINRRLLVVDIFGGEQEDQSLVVVNPRITLQEGSVRAEEGCLSIPGFTAMVIRPFRVRVRAQDLEGKELMIDAEDLLARALCHEIDHLDGVLYLDRISMLKRDLIKRKIRKLVKKGEW